MVATKKARWTLSRPCPDHDTQDGQPIVTVGGQREQGDVEGQKREGGAVEAQGSLDRHRPRADGEDRERQAAANHQREGLEQHEGDVEGAAVARVGLLLELGQGEPGGDQRHKPVHQQRMQPRQPSLDGGPSVHGQTLPPPAPRASPWLMIATP